MSAKINSNNKENNVLLEESGKFFLDLAKLTFGGLFLTSIFEMHYDLVLVMLYGFANIKLIVILGFFLIKISSNK